jgi:hypothetical protein
MTRTPIPGDPCPAVVSCIIRFSRPLLHLRTQILPWTNTYGCWKPTLYSQLSAREKPPSELHYMDIKVTYPIHVHTSSCLADIHQQCLGIQLVRVSVVLPTPGRHMRGAYKGTPTSQFWRGVRLRFRVVGRAFMQPWIRRPIRSQDQLRNATPTPRGRSVMARATVVKPRTTNTEVSQILVRRDRITFYARHGSVLVPVLPRPSIST